MQVVNHRLVNPTLWQLFAWNRAPADEERSHWTKIFR